MLFTYYAYRDSIMHRLDPRVKALWVAVGVLYIFSTEDWRILLLLAAINLALARLAGFPMRVLLPMFRALVLFGVVILVFQLLFQRGETLWALGPIGLHAQGLIVTREVWLRLANLSLLFVGYVMWTPPAQIALMWVRFGLPYRYAMLGGLALRFFPIMQGEVTRIQEAQQVRGQPMHTIPQRIRGLVAVVLPLVLRALRRTNEIALAMELRAFGFDRTRTFSQRIVMLPLDWVVGGVLLVAAGWRVAVLVGL